MAAFVLTRIVGDSRAAKETAAKTSLVSVCLEHFNHPSPLMRQWVVICLGKSWEHYENARWMGVRDTAHEKLYVLLNDPCPEVNPNGILYEQDFI
jgi:regulator-associated protein of mTOR